MVEPLLVVKFIFANPDVTEAGVVHVIVLLTIAMLVALTSLKVSAITVPPSLLPEIVTLVPPAVDPEPGETPVMLGTSAASLY